MQVEPREREVEKTVGIQGGHASPRPERLRFRTGQALLHRQADRRRNRANLMVLVSFAGVLVLVKILYELLSR